MTYTFYTSLNAVRRTLSLDLACPESDFENQGIFIHEAIELPGRRKFPFRGDKSFVAASMGRGVVISIGMKRMRWARINLSKLSRDDIFAPYIIHRIDEYVGRDRQFMAGPDLKHICAPEMFKPFTADKAVEISLAEDAKLLEVYNDPRFPNTLGHPGNPRMVAAVARVGGQIAGMAGASADTDTLWGIGVDTLPEYRQRGIGKATVSALTEYVLERGFVPYYSTFMDNLASRSVALALGYKTAWVELYARDIAEPAA